MPLLIRKPSVNKDVQDCSGNELTFSSDKNTQKDSNRGKVTKTISGFEYQVVIFNHALGYIPSFKIFYDNNDGVWHDASNGVTDYAGPTYNNCIFYADANNLYMDGFTGTYNVKYFVFRNNG